MSDPLTVNFHPVISPTGIIHVLGYTPTEGERGVPITVRIHFHPELADTMYVRLVVGNKAVPTRVCELHGTTYGRFQLHAAAPPFDRLQFPSTKVLISIEALNGENAVLDSVTFGEFSYWAPGSTHDQRSQVTPTRLHRRMKPQSLVRTKHHPDHLADQEDMYAQTPILDLVTPLPPICIGWSPAELSAGRRLVRFIKVQDGRRLIVSCEPITQDEYCESDSVISCIYREELDTCFVTSVDVIYLLERLTNGEFPVEEKNRIRRNLEGLRPTTVSKHKAGFGDFFQRIMDFPDPKPRNIEKDLKVFEWNLLGQALEKILSKYSIYTSPMPEIVESSPVETDTLVSPVESNVSSSSSSSCSSAFPLFASETTEPVKSEESHPWASGSDFNKPNEMLLEHYPILGAYEAVEGGDHNFGDPALDFNIYDNFTFHGLPEENLVSISENYI